MTKNKTNWSFFVSIILAIALVFGLSAYSDLKKASANAVQDNGQVQELQSQVADLQATITAKNNAIEEKTSQIEELQAQVEELSIDAESNASLIENLNAEINDLSSDIESLTAELEEAQAELENWENTGNAFGYTVVDNGVFMIVALRMSNDSYAQFDFYNNQDVISSFVIADFVSGLSSTLGSIALNHYYNFSNQFTNTSFSLPEAIAYSYVDSDINANFSVAFDFSELGIPNISDLSDLISLGYSSAFYWDEFECELYSDEEAEEVGYESGPLGKIKSVSVTIHLIDVIQ